MEALMADEVFDFEQLHTRYRPKIHRYLCRLAGENEGPKIHRYLCRLAGENEAEDLCQEVFVKVERNLTSFRNEAQLSTWLYRIATNSFYDRLRSPSFKQKSKEYPIEIDDNTLEKRDFTSQQQKPGIDQQVIRDEMNACIRGYIDQLPENYRTVLLLSEEEGFKNREIAEILQVSLDNVKIRLHRAKAKLKVSLQGNCDFYLDERSEISCDRKQKRDRE
jgi:RNA polymerase sigma-70 factor (ECF subfamily)